MTVNANEVRKEVKLGNDVATVFTFSFTIYAASDLEVVFTSVGGVETILSEGSGTTDYSVSVASFPGTGSITYPATLGTELATGEKLTIRAVQPLEQLTDLENQGGYFPEVQETQFDKLVRIDKQQQESIDRAIKISSSDQSNPNLEFTESASDRASKVLGFDSVGDLAVLEVSTTSAVTDNILNMTALRLVTGTANQRISLLGHATANDGGGGDFVWDTSSTATDNDGTIIKATATTTGRWLRLFSGAVNIRWFGAKGDGTTDDATAVQAAIDVGVGVYVPSGDHLISSTITVSAANITVFGNGLDSVLKMNDGTFNLFTLTNADNFELAFIEMQGAATTATDEKYAVFTTEANPSENVRTHDCTFTGVSASAGFTNAMKIDADCHGALIRGNKIDSLIGTAAGFGYGVLFGSANNCIVTSNTFIGAASRGRHAIYITSGASDGVFANNVINDFNGASITVAASDAQDPCENNVIMGNVVNGGNNLATGDGGISIFGNCNFNTIIGNTIRGVNKNGIVLNGSLSADTSRSSKTLIANNLLRGIGRIGIDIGGVLSTLVIGNKLHNVAQVTASVPFIRVIKDASTSVAAADTTLIGNQTSGNGHSGIQLNSSSPAPTGTKAYSNVLEADTNDYDTNGEAIEIDGAILHFTSHNFGSLADGASETASFTVTGATRSSIATVQVRQLENGFQATAWVQNTDTVRVTVTNNTGGVVDLADSNVYIRVYVWPPNIALS